jgi:hypothetical protein
MNCPSGPLLDELSLWSPVPLVPLVPLVAWVDAVPKLTAFSHSAGLNRGPPTDASHCLLATYFSDPGHRGLPTR